MSSDSNPRRYNRVGSPAEVVIPTSILNQSIFSSGSFVDLGGITFVINALLSLANASFLNPSATKDNCPKLEFEFVIDASPPLSIEKCLL